MMRIAYLLSVSLLALLLLLLLVVVVLSDRFPREDARAGSSRLRRQSRRKSIERPDSSNPITRYVPRVALINWFRGRREVQPVLLLPLFRAQTHTHTLSLSLFE